MVLSSDPLTRAEGRVFSARRGKESQTLSLALKRKITDRLLELSPRAFEFFAGDLLEYLGLGSVRVTRQTGDGGIDAECEIIAASLVRVPTGVQVKRLRRSVHRPDMDRFLGALANRYSSGIFITTGEFTQTALRKANISIPHISTINGRQVADIMVTSGLGMHDGTESIDEDYFGVFERGVRIAECSPGYDAGATRDVAPADDLISLRALSHALRVDTTTIRNWIERGQLRPDAGDGRQAGDGLFFRRLRIQEIRQQYNVQPGPKSKEEWLEEFLRFAMRGRLNMSYKPVMLLAMLNLVDKDGTVEESALVEAFRAFYLTRSESGLVPEASSSPLSRPESASLSAARSLLIKYPLERFIIKGYLEHRPEERRILFRPEVWEGLRFQDVLALRQSLHDQIDRYYCHIGGPQPLPK